MSESPARIDVCGLPIDPLTMAESVERAATLIATGRPHQHVVVNAAKVVQAHDDPEILEIISSCDLVNADGQSVVWASRILGRPLPERVAGIDFMRAMWRRAAVEGWRVYLLGARPEAVRRAAEVASGEGVSIAGARDGYWAADDELTVVEEIRQAAPDLLFIAIPSPRKEQFLSTHLDQMNVPLVVGVGGSFDVVAGVTRRAPLWMQRVGLEWLYRLAQEPRRMFGRYLVGNTRFVSLVARSWWRERINDGTTP